MFAFLIGPWFGTFCLVGFVLFSLVCSITPAFSSVSFVLCCFLLSSFVSLCFRFVCFGAFAFGGEFYFYNYKITLSISIGYIYMCVCVLYICTLLLLFCCCFLVPRWWFAFLFKGISIASRLTVPLLAPGMAIAEAHLAARFNKEGFPLFDNYTYVLAGDGCLMDSWAKRRLTRRLASFHGFFEL